MRGKQIEIERVRESEKEIVGDREIESRESEKEEVERDERVRRR